MIYVETDLHHLFLMVEQCSGVQQDPKHHPEGDVFIHSIQCVEWAFRETTDIDLIFAALLHDVGKAKNTLGHDKIAVEMLYGLVSEKTLFLIEHHLRIWYLLTGEMRRRQKVLDLIGHPFLPELIHLARIDKLGRNPNKQIKYSRAGILDRINNIIKERYAA